MALPIVTHYERKRREAGNYSLEAIFADVRARLAEECPILVRSAPQESNGVLRRTQILLDVWRHRDEPLHLTGDIHFAAIAARRDRSILTIHDCSGLVERRGWRAYLMKLLWFRLPVKQVAKVTTVSNASKNDILAVTGCSPEKVIVIHNAVSEKFIPVEKQFGDTRPRILQVGTSFNKNIERTAQALAEIPSTLVVVGRLSPSQRTAIETSGLDFENYVNLSEDELIEQYQRCDIVAFVSTFEGFGMPIVEAQRVGRPVVTSNCSSMPEIAGDGACYVDPMDVTSIRDGFCRVIGDVTFREGLIQRGFKNANRFNPDSVARRYLDLYREVFDDAKDER